MTKALFSLRRIRSKALCSRSRAFQISLYSSSSLFFSYRYSTDILSLSLFFHLTFGVPACRIAWRGVLMQGDLVVASLGVQVAEHNVGVAPRLSENENASGHGVGQAYLEPLDWRNRPLEPAR